MRENKINYQEDDCQNEIHGRTRDRDNPRFLTCGHSGAVASRTGIYIDCAGRGEDETEKGTCKRNEQTYTPHSVLGEEAVPSSHITVPQFMKHKTQGNSYKGHKDVGTERSEIEKRAKTTGERDTECDG